MDGKIELQKKRGLITTVIDPTGIANSSGSPIKQSWDEN
jgi:hypothetical protein